MALPKRPPEIRKHLGRFGVEGAPSDAERLPALCDEDAVAQAVGLEALRGAVDGAAVELNRHPLTLPEGVYLEEPPAHREVAVHPRPT
jgi:hypothetical protein